jgi:hypothetical protein
MSLASVPCEVAPASHTTGSTNHLDEFHHTRDFRHLHFLVPCARHDAIQGKWNLFSEECLFQDTFFRLGETSSGHELWLRSRRDVYSTKTLALMLSETWEFLRELPSLEGSTWRHRDLQTPG